MNKELREKILADLDRFVRPGHKRPARWETYNVKQLLQTQFALEQMCRPVAEPDDPDLFNPNLHPDWVEEKQREKAHDS